MKCDVLPLSLHHLKGVQTPDNTRFISIDLKLGTGQAEIIPIEPVRVML